MRPVLFRYRGIDVHAYAAMLYVGLVLGIIGGYLAAMRSGLDATRVYEATLVLTVPALTGARLLFVALHWDVYRRAPRRIFRPSEGGAALYGGLLASLVVSIALLPAMGLEFWAFWDIATVTMLIGMIFTKVGCLLGGCCAGRPTAGLAGLYLPDQRGVWARRVPSQLLEAALALFLLIAVVVAWPHAPFKGAVFLCTVLAYGAGRLVLESTRDTIDRLGSISVNRVISSSLAGLSIAALLARWLSAAGAP